MITQVIKELVSLPVELFVQDEEVQAKLEAGLDAAIDTIGLATGDFSTLFPELTGGGEGDALPPDLETPTGTGLPSEALRWLA